jgi:hypothetical protein
MGMLSTSPSICRHSSLRRETAGRSDLLDFVTAVAHRCEHQGELLADAFDRGADQVSPAVEVPQSDVGSVGRRCLSEALVHSGGREA